jgi:hypothetical protein
MRWGVGEVDTSGRKGKGSVTMKRTIRKEKQEGSGKLYCDNKRSRRKERRKVNGNDSEIMWKRSRKEREERKGIECKRRKERFGERGWRGWGVGGEKGRG